MHVPDTKDVERERVLSGHPVYVREIENFERFVAALRKAGEPSDYRDLHHALFANFLGCQRWLEQLTKQKTELKAGIRSAKAARSETAVRSLSREIAGNDVDRHASKAILGLYRCLGDALVWHLLDFRRDAITLLGEGKRVDRLADDEGLRAELAEIEWLWREHGIVAVHADLTTCIQHGDVLSVEEWDPRRIRLTEVKAGRGAAAGSRQMKRLEQVTTTINEGLHPTAAEGKPLIVRRCPLSVRSHLDLLPEAIADARRVTYTSFSPEPALLVEIYDETNPARLSREEVNGRHESAFEALAHGREPNDLISYSVSARRLRDRLHSFSSLAPLALLPLPPRDVAGLATGGLDMVTTLDAVQVEANLASAGISARIARGEAAGDSFLTAERGAARVTVPAPVRERVALELMTLETLAETLDWMLAQIAGGGPQPAAVLAHAGEAELWGAPVPTR